MKGHPDGFLSHFSSLRNIWLGRFFDSLRHKTPWLRASVHYLRDSPPFPAGCTFGVRMRRPLRSVVIARPFCLRASAFPFGAAQRAVSPGPIIRHLFSSGVIRRGPFRALLTIPFSTRFCQQLFQNFSEFCSHCTKRFPTSAHKIRTGGIYFPASLCY